MKISIFFFRATVSLKKRHSKVVSLVCMPPIKLSCYETFNSTSFCLTDWLTFSPFLSVFENVIVYVKSLLQSYLIFGVTQLYRGICLHILESRRVKKNSSGMMKLWLMPTGIKVLPRVSLLILSRIMGRSVAKNSLNDTFGTENVTMFTEKSVINFVTRSLIRLMWSLLGVDERGAALLSGGRVAGV